MTTNTKQFGRKVSLQVFQTLDGTATTNIVEAIDLSAMHFTFKTENADEEGPGNCSVRVFNLSQTTVEKIIKFDFNKIILQAGYEGSFGTIFSGTIKQFRVGRVDARDTYLDLLAADGDLAYNFATVNASLEAGQTSKTKQLDVVAKSLEKLGITNGQITGLESSGGVLPRGKALWGLSKVLMRDFCESTGTSWSIANGKLTLVPLDGYLPGEAVQLNAGTGLIGVPEATQAGLTLTCLLNPKIVLGGRVQVNNAVLGGGSRDNTTTINETRSAQKTVGFQLAYNQWAAIEQYADISRDGFYRVFICEHEGDTRGGSWYTHLTVLAIDPTSRRVTLNG